MNLSQALGSLRRSSAGLSDAIKRIPIKLALRVREAQEVREEEERERARAAGPTLADRLDDLQRFYSRYESLVEILVESSQRGVTPKLEAEYERQRVWMQLNYSDIRRYVVAYLQYESGDAAQNYELEGHSGDAFEALFAALTLEAFLRADDGNMISRIVRTRTALSLYGEHLRQLMEREKDARKLPKR
ncbi:MAG TPA: hypothetical protein VEX38_02840 [Fimbriimonadaceae bacterium]|nr:hypothetical protein [Fimbriimonadaceae bacterium]